MQAQRIHYSRSRFSASLPDDCRYTPAHLWMRRDVESADHWFVGFTRFATRMLGEVVEFDLEPEPGSPVAKGDVIGWLEGFKAVTDIYVPFDGHYEGTNPALADRIDLIDRRGHDDGWLFRLRGEPGEDCIDVHGYIEVLDATIDKMLGKAR